MGFTSAKWPTLHRPCVSDASMQLIIAESSDGNSSSNVVSWVTVSLHSFFYFGDVNRILAKWNTFGFLTSFPV